MMQQLDNARDSDAGDPVNAENIDITMPDAEQLTYSSPAVRKLARELDVNLVQVIGTGLRGRITRDDVQAHVRSIV